MYFAINIAFYFICDQYLEGVVSSGRRVEALTCLCQCLGSSFKDHPLPLCCFWGLTEGTGIRINNFILSP